PVIIEEVCKYVSTVTLPPTFKNISINLSSIDCQVDNFDRIILDTIERYKIDPSFLIFEVTETIAFISPKIEKTMKNLKDHNILLALDDFGSGYANIDTLTKLPFDIVKIDRDMILLLNSVRYKTITLAIIRTIIDYGFDVIVEGVENKELAEVLKKNGAVHHQGFFY
ncbi:MAG: EAL domain-containing protein, partial [Sphaerochaetaceae bacterium]|nr:EAL domain-containing protein [Sphaerochaetaceae bacterium]